MSRSWLTRRASFTDSSEQHLFSATCSTPSSTAAAGSDQRRSMMPITSWPCSLSSAAATELSTPPLMATTILAILDTCLGFPCLPFPHMVGRCCYLVRKSEQKKRPARLKGQPHGAQKNYLP